MTASRKLWLDTSGLPVITTTPNGKCNAARWGWTPAVAVAEGSLDPADFVSTNEAPERLDALQALCDLARRGRDDFLHQAGYGDYSPEDVDRAAEEWEAVSELIERIEYLLDPASHHETQGETTP